MGLIYQADFKAVKRNYSTAFPVCNHSNGIHYRLLSISLKENNITSLITLYAKIKSMKSFNLVFIDSVSEKKITSLEDILQNGRLAKFLWIEFILNPQLVQDIASYRDNPVIKDSLSDALSWYAAFRWLFPVNKTLEELRDNNEIITYRVTDNIYRQKRRNFLKGILHARLC
ncbi:MAG: hypothetical protein HY757_06155 [Nitrospirae bacterium]|nr:hypothetical protein [Nitrospirota bacterium]